MIVFVTIKTYLTEVGTTRTKTLFCKLNAHCIIAQVPASNKAICIDEFVQYKVAEHIEHARKSTNIRGFCPSISTSVPLMPIRIAEKTPRIIPLM